MPSSVDEYMKGLLTPRSITSPRVISQHLSTSAQPAASPVRLPDETDPGFEDKVYALFGQYPSATVILKKEKPRHRLALWLRLNGHTNKEIATLLGFNENYVSQIVKQKWFLDAFAQLSTEMGKDAVSTFLEGTVLDTCEQLVHLSKNADSDAVKKAACDSILDRVRGKPVAKSEMKVSGGTSVTVFDAAKLLEESKRNAEILKGRGIGGN